MASTKQRWLNQQKKELIAEYLAETGSETVVVSDFLDFIEARPDHPLHQYLFGKDDGYHARQNRLNMLRQWMSGVRVEVAVVTQGEPVSVDLPGMVSPLETRSTGGGYVIVDPARADHRAELAVQAAESLAQWIERNRGLCATLDIDVSPARGLETALRTAATYVRLAAE